MLIALAAYATYVVNAAQFLWKLRMARLEGERRKPGRRACARPHDERAPLPPKGCAERPILASAASAKCSAG
jgi:hypothetical protein